MTTTSDYDARRVSDVETPDASALRDLANNGAPTAVVDEDPNDVVFFELPGADLSGEELSVTVIPQRSDEFTCSSCFLVQHRSRLRPSSSGQPICADCA
ncbi:cytochrome [Mycobacterium sp. 1554424.7]|nr:cytochrome [Mycobacterium sp. 1554424.7]